MFTEHIKFLQDFMKQTNNKSYHNLQAVYLFS